MAHCTLLSCFTLAVTFKAHRLAALYILQVLLVLSLSSSISNRMSLPLLLSSRTWTTWLRWAKITPLLNLRHISQTCSIWRTSMHQLWGSYHEASTFPPGRQWYLTIGKKTTNIHSLAILLSLPGSVRSSCPIWPFKISGLTSWMQISFLRFDTCGLLFFQ